MPTYIKYGLYLSPSFPMISSKKWFIPPTAVSKISCFLLTRSTDRFLTRQIHSNVTTAIIIQVTTTDSEIGIPPKIGIVNAVSQFNSSNNCVPKFSVSIHSLSSFFVRLIIQLWFWDTIRNPRIIWRISFVFFSSLYIVFLEMRVWLIF